MYFQPPTPKSSSWDRKEDTVCTLPSIWRKGPFKKKVEAPTFINPGRPITKGKEVTVAIPSFFKAKHKLGKYAHHLPSFMLLDHSDKEGKRGRRKEV